MLPRLSKIDFFDDVFDDPFFKNEKNLMKTDIKKEGDDYALEIDLPGYKKEDIKIDLNDGYLTIEASTKREEKDESESYIHRERFSGTCKRSYYVGNNINEDDIKASFKDGILKVSFPSNKDQITSEKKYIQIED